MQKRDHFRITYPEQITRPKIMMDGDYYDIVDISEYGIKFNDDHSWGVKFKLKEKVKGVTKLRHGQTLSLEGVVNRIKDREVAIKLSKRIPRKIIAREESYLIKNIPIYR